MSLRACVCVCLVTFRHDHLGHSPRHLQKKEHLAEKLRVCVCVCVSNVRYQSYVCSIVNEVANGAQTVFAMACVCVCAGTSWSSTPAASSAAYS